MAPLPANNTAVYFVDYYDGINAHTLQNRYNEGEVTIDQAGLMLDAFFTAIDNLLYEITILGARNREANSTVTYGVIWPGAETYGSGAQPAVTAPRETRWVGRSGTGRRVSFSVYGGKYTTPDNFRILAADNADVLAGIVAIDDAVTNNGMRPIDLSNQQMKPYVDVNFNSYWERAARG